MGWVWFMLLFIVLSSRGSFYGPSGRLIRKVYVGPRIIRTWNDGLACHALAAIVVTVGAVVNLFIMGEMAISTDQVGPVAQVGVAHQKIGSSGLYSMLMWHLLHTSWLSSRWLGTSS